MGDDGSMKVAVVLEDESKIDLVADDVAQFKT
jgi:hypothetical protein